jgi:hypothetical protein
MNSLIFSTLSYPYGLKTGTAFGPISQLPSTLRIQCGSKNGYSGNLGTEYTLDFVRLLYSLGTFQYSPLKCTSVTFFATPTSCAISTASPPAALIKNFA